MRMLLFVTAFTSVTVRGEEASGVTMRQKLHARILESAPPPAPLKAPVEQSEEEAPPPVVMKPLVVSDSKLLREVTAALDQAKQNRLEERFSPMKGGKIATLGPMQLGGWFTVDEGWTFLRLNKPRTPRQVEATEAMLKDLQELADMAEGRKPSPQPIVTKPPLWRRTNSDR